MLKRKVAEIWRVFTRRRGDAEEGGKKAESGNLRDESGPLAHGKAWGSLLKEARRATRAGAREAKMKSADVAD